MFNKLFPPPPEFKTNEEIILRDYLALERTHLANERTLLSFVRTFLYLTLTGIALLQIEGYDEIKWMGSFIIGISLVILVVGILRFRQLRKRLKQYYS